MTCCSTAGVRVGILPLSVVGRQKQNRRALRASQAKLFILMASMAITGSGHLLWRGVPIVSTLVRIPKTLASSRIVNICIFAIRKEPSVGDLISPQNTTSKQSQGFIGLGGSS